MNEEEQDRLLDRIGKVFLGCFLMSAAFMFLWISVYLTAGNWLYAVNVRYFDVSRRDFTLLNYWGLGLTKVGAFVFFLFPYLSIKAILRKT